MLGHSRTHHDHGPSHAHLHSAEQGIRAAFWLNFLFALLEVAGGFWTNSLSVMSDALHDLGDSLILGIAWFLEKRSRQKGDESFSYGYRRLSTVSALGGGVILILGSVLIIIHAWPRLLHPETPNVKGMLALSLLGIVMNALAYRRMAKGSSLNERVLRWHFIEDIMGWCLVLLGSVVMWIWEIPALDAGLAIVLACWVMWNVTKTLREVLRVFLQAVPPHLSLEEVRQFIRRNEVVKDVHHLHLWSVDGEQHILTAHVVLDPHCQMTAVPELKRHLKHEMLHHFGISEATLEFEWPDETCFDPHHP